MVKRSGLTGRQKAAVLMILLGPELSAMVMRNLREHEIEQITLGLAEIDLVASETQDNVLAEFHQMCVAEHYIAQGGLAYAREILERALGPQKAMDLIHRLTSALQVRPFDFARKTEPSQLLNFIQNEHPQTIALIMAYLHPDQSSAILSSLNPELQADVAKRIAIMDRTSPEVVREVEKVLQKKLSSVLTEDYARVGGIDSLVEVLNRVDRGTEKAIMETLAMQDPELVEEIKRRMFVFEDIVYLDDRSLQRILREVDYSRDLPLALKGASEDVKAKIFKNISKRAGEMLKENLEYLGPVRLREVEESQQKIVNIIRRLEEEGEIVIARGGGDEILV